MMNQTEQELALKIARQLDRGAEQLPPETRERLTAARRAALSRYREQPQAVAGLAWAGQALARFAGERQSARLLAVASTLVVVIASVVYWQSSPAGNDYTEIDMSLLTDELPLNAYLDQGFDSWLKRSPR